MVLYSGLSLAKLMAVNLVQPVNANGLNVFILAGRFMLVRLLQLEKAYSSIDNTELGITTSVRELQQSNAYWLILGTPSSNITFLISDAYVRHGCLLDEYLGMNCVPLMVKVCVDSLYEQVRGTVVGSTKIRFTIPAYLELQATASATWQMVEPSNLKSSQPPSSFQS